MPELAIALSGGVDSSVAAALLTAEGRDAFGVTMRLGLADIADRACCGEEEALLARRVCAQLGISHVIVDVAEEFRLNVVEPYCDAYVSGLTPNPCVRCNETVKFGELVTRVRRLGATKLATGHYARTVGTPDGTRLRRAADPAKDQSYFLYRVPPAVLDMLEFPLGDLSKDRVRAIAADLGLPTAARPDSQEVCFVSPGDDLVARLRPGAVRPGPVLDISGAVIGRHEGLHRYTIGQRKGLGVGGSGGPWYVVGIDTARNAVVAGTRHDLEVSVMTLADPVWHSPGPSVRARAQVRYGAAPVDATADFDGEKVTVTFDTPVSATAPGQSVVLYADDVVVGGGTVSMSVA